MTQKDIAKRVGVSVSTVSRVLSNKDTKAASKEIKEQIWQVVCEEGYTPSDAARQLRKGKHKDKSSRYITCIYALSRDNRDAFFAEMASAIVYELYKHHYILQYSVYAGDMDVEAFSAALNNDDIAGYIVMGRFDNAQLRDIVEAKKNVVYVGLNCSSDTHDAVYCDAFKASQCAMEEFYRLNHRQVAYLGEKSRERRYVGYRHFITEKKMPELAVETKHSLEGGYRGAEALLATKRAFTGIFCANDEAAMGAIRALREHNLRVPEDVSVISVDDVDVAQYFSPMLTTVHIPISELGRQAARMLVDKIESSRAIPLKMELPFKLARRDSSSACK